VSISVEIDKKGRFVLPKGIRERLMTNKLLLVDAGNHVDILPIPDIKTLKGKYKLKHSIEETEELQEKIVLQRIS